MKRISFILVLIALTLVTRLCSQISATDSILRHWLQPQVVTNQSPVFNTFYFWTSSAELDTSLLQNQLIRKAPTNGFYSYEFAFYDNLYFESLRSNAPILNHLMGAERQRTLSVWPCYWENMSGMSGTPHKDQLVQVVLMDSALIVSFFPDEKKSQRWAVHDLKGNSLTVEDAMKRKRHIAAVYMCSEYRSQVFGTITKRITPGHYRGFVLCNESMIKSWHHAVPGLQARLLKDFDYLMLLNAWFESPANCATQGKNGKVSYAAWNMSSSQMSVSDLFFGVQQYSGNTALNANQSVTTSYMDSLRIRFRTQVNPCERFPGKK